MHLIQVVPDVEHGRYPCMRQTACCARTLLDRPSMSSFYERNAGPTPDSDTAGAKPEGDTLRRPNSCRRSDGPLGRVSFPSRFHRFYGPAFAPVVFLGDRAFRPELAAPESIDRNWFPGRADDDAVVRRRSKPNTSEHNHLPVHSQVRDKENMSSSPQNEKHNCHRIDWICNGKYAQLSLLPEV